MQTQHVAPRKVTATARKGGTLRQGNRNSLHMAPTTANTYAGNVGTFGTNAHSPSCRAVGGRGCSCGAVRGTAQVNASAAMACVAIVKGIARNQGMPAAKAYLATLAPKRQRAILAALAAG